MNESNYFIKSEYITNSNPINYTATLEEDLVYQRPVYEFAADIVTKYHCDSAIDLGCGLGQKLEIYLKNVCSNIVGIDCEKNIGYCKNNYTFGRWYSDDLENRKIEYSEKFELVICADVIEHVFNPNLLLDYIKNIVHNNSHILISTPERDLRRGTDHIGPPNNPAHIREWSRKELGNYLEHSGFEIVSHQIVELREGMNTCQLVHCKFSNLD